jgi:competence protein ComEA
VPRSRLAAQSALGVFVLCLFGLLLYRTYSPRLVARPTEESGSVPVGNRSVDLNTADRAELLQLPGVGPILADAILAHRTGNGRFHTIEDLAAVHGIGGKTLDKLRPLLTVSEPAVDKLERKPRVEPQTPASRVGKIQPGEPKIDVNRAGEAELQRLPRVGPVLAAAIVAARTESRFATVDDLRRVRGIGPKTLDALRPFVTTGDE